ncbi:MAG: Peptidase flavivirus helicase, partial [Bryobacterales bacterium]|nr:Peptidase flavivirus helicase [Bryobacterales bacterium]
VLVSLPFAFGFYGTSYSQICISSNGAAYFLGNPGVCSAINDFASSDLTAGSPAADYAGIFPLWSDLTFQVPGAGAVFYQVQGTAPDRRIVIQWNKAYPQGSANPVTFEAILQESTNSVVFQYQTVNLGPGNPASNGGRATVALRNAGAQASNQQVQWSYRSAVLADGTGLLVTVGAGPFPPTLSSPANGGTSVAVPVTLSWGASAGATSYDVFLGSTSPPAFVANVAGTSYSTAGVSAATAYSWQVVAKNALGSGASATWTFTTAAVPPPGGGGSGGGGGGGGGGAALTVSTDTVTLTAPLNAGVAKQAVTLSFQTYAQGVPTLTSNVSTNQGFGWLSVTPSTSVMTQTSYAGFLYTYQGTATINVDPTGIAAGTVYTGTASFAAGGGISLVNVTMNVTAQGAVFTVAPATVQFSYRIGDSRLPAAQSLSVTSKPSGTVFAVSATTATGGDWLAVSPARGDSPGTVSVSLKANVVASLGAGSYAGKVTLTGTAAPAVEIPVALNVSRADAPAVPLGGVVPVYSTSNAIQAGSWISIYGTNLAATTEVWKGDFPTTLGGVSVTVNGKPGYLWFVSPTQINLQAPDDAATGTVNVVITNGTGTTTSTVTLAAASPSLSLLDGKHVAAVIPEPNGYSIVGAKGEFAFETRPVLPGENLILYGVGFGPTRPAVKAGELFSSAAPTVDPVTVTIGGVPAPVAFAGLVGAGLYQLNVTVPTVAAGDQPVLATVGGVSVGAGPVVTVGAP